MQHLALLSRLGALCVALAVLLPAPSELRAQPGDPAPANKPPAAANTEDLNQLSQAELLKSYLQMREQLQATQMAIVNNRVAAVTEKIDAMKSALDAERDRQQVELQRAAAERERQLAEMQRSNRTVLWLAATFGVVGLLAMCFTPFFQWRAVNRMAEVASGQAQLTAPTRPALLGPEGDAPSSEPVTLSTQRLMSVIDRMERRILELEGTATTLPATTTTTTTTLPPANGSDASRRSAADSDQAVWITVLLAKGRSLLTANKAKEAVACYDEILKLDPNHPEALVKKGSALERLKQDDAALRCYDRAIEIDGRLTLAYLYKAGVCNRMKRYDEALECYELALQSEEKAGK